MFFCCGVPISTLPLLMVYGIILSHCKVVGWEMEGGWETIEYLTETEHDILCSEVLKIK